MRLVLDWDGTVTERDTLDLVLQAFGDPEIYERVEAELDAGRMTLNDVIAAEFATVTVPLGEAVEYVVEHTRLRPGFAELARARHPLVVSSGFRELIEPVLEREGVLGEVELRANRVEDRPEGWRVHFRVAEPCDECGEPCKRGDLPEGEIVYAGDGHSDYCASLAADRVFAIGGLARWLDRRGVEHEPLTDFYALASEL
ncbi:MAG TPA: haloacid dehalogenase-like hydrolase [Gaiellaceae bacterium]|nr:haloacid dehalogenase-like hydrolase [Gaiellaceae bacterium]